MRARKFLLVAAAGLASAAFSYLGTGLHPIWWLLWLAPVPVLAIAPRLRGSAAFLLGSFAWLIGEMNQWNYVTHEIEMPLQIVILFFVIPAVAFGFGVLFMRSFLRRGSLFLASLAFPVYWVAYEYLTEIGSPHSTWGNLAYTQMNCLPIIQVASITGLWGISNRGRILAETATAPGRFVSITGKVNVTPAATFYTRTGDWFAWLCVAMFLVLLASRFFSRRSQPASNVKCNPGDWSRRESSDNTDTSFPLA